VCGERGVALLLLILAWSLPWGTWDGPVVAGVEIWLSELKGLKMYEL